MNAPDRWEKVSADEWFDMLSPYIVGEWPEELAVKDLRFWLNEQRWEGGRPWPSRPQLMKRWGWTDWRVRELLKRDALWKDPKRPVPPEKLQPRHTPPHLPSGAKVHVFQPRRLPDASQTITQTERANAEYLAVSNPDASQTITQTPPSRVPLSEEERTEEAVRMVWGLIVGLEPTHRSRNGLPRKDQAEHIRARIADEGLDSVLAVVRYVHEKPYRSKFWGPVNKKPQSYLLPKHFSGLLSDAREAGLDAPILDKLTWQDAEDPAFKAWIDSTAAPKLLELAPTPENWDKAWDWWRSTVVAKSAEDPLWTTAWEASRNLRRTLRLM